ncbi:MAG: type IV pilus assembly protein PilM [Proteobacteria bacterium]|nr:type IV pilus assembly protein PilM [Pseudomonadota bacterium]
MKSLDLNKSVIKSKVKPYLAIDIGSSYTKLLVYDNSQHRSRFICSAIGPTPKDTLVNKCVTKPEVLGAYIRELMIRNNISATEVVFALPSNAVFVKKIQTTNSSIKDLTDNLKFEAANYIPHSIDDVYLDFQVLKSLGKGSNEVLLVAAKKEVVDGYLKTMEKAKLETIIVDVDAFALGNTYENSYQDKSTTLATIAIGQRNSIINIISNGDFVYNGEISIGTKNYSDALITNLSLEQAQAEEKLKNIDGEDSQVKEIIEQVHQKVSDEICSQVSFFWTSSGIDNTISKICITGGGAKIEGLKEAIAAKSGIACDLIKPFKGVDNLPSSSSLLSSEDLFSIVSGLALRKLGDKSNRTN